MNFFILLKEVLPLLINMSEFAYSYSHYDSIAFCRLAECAHLFRCLKVLRFKSIFGEHEHVSMNVSRHSSLLSVIQYHACYTDNDLPHNDLCPWLRRDWSTNLAKFTTVETFLLQTPTSVIYLPAELRFGLDEARMELLKGWVEKTGPSLGRVGILCDYSYNRDENLEDLKDEIRSTVDNVDLIDEYRAEYWSIAFWTSYGLKKTEDGWKEVCDWRKEFDCKVYDVFGERFRI
jgi:hypothetical protein